MIHCCLVNNHEPIIRGGFFYIAPEFPHMGHTVTVCFAHFLFFLYRTKWEQLCHLLLHIAQPPSPGSQRVRVMTGSNVRPTLGWYVLCLCPVLPQWAYGRRCWRLTSVLSPLPTNWAEANMIVFNSGNILMQGYALTGFIGHFCLIYWLFCLLLKS